uniref:tetratricopeptide repeat protein n=1 Tax=Trichocoleus desertorum TaxID=1481672 RepID=UPI0025B43E73|nr:tetratricopeptide repeat protein [Trichocoleus desertorum]
MSSTQSFQSSHARSRYPYQQTTSTRNSQSTRLQDSIDPRRRLEYEAAIASCDRTIARQPDDVNAWYERGQAQANLGSYVEAIASFNKALALKPQHTAALVFRAVAFIHLSCYEEALLSCNTALAIQPHHSEAWLFRGVALRSLHRYQAAYVSYDNALGIRRPSLWQNILRILGCFASRNRQH